MKRLFTLSACALTAAALCCGSNPAHADWKSWSSKQRSAQNSTQNLVPFQSVQSSSGPVVRDHRKTSKPLSPLGPFTPTTNTAPIVRDHRDGSSSGGGVVVTPTNGPVIRDHRKPSWPFNTTTPWTPTDPTTTPPGGGTVVDPKPPRKPPFGVPTFPLEPVLDPGTPKPPKRPPFDVPTFPLEPVLDPGTTPPPTNPPPTNPPPTNPPPTNPPGQGTGNGHQHHWERWFTNYYFNRPYYSGRPIVIQQPVYTTPVYSQPIVTQSAPLTTIEGAQQLTQVPVGATITLSGESFGQNRGAVGVLAGELMLAAEVVNWSNTQVTVKVPQLALAGPAKAKFVVFRADQSVANETPFELVPAAAN